MHCAAATRWQTTPAAVLVEQRRSTPRSPSALRAVTWSPTAAQAARVLGHLTIVGVGNATLPVSFTSPPHECSVASPFWGSIPELIEVIALARSGKIKMLVEHFALEDAAHAYHLLHDGKIPGRAVITPNN